MTFIHLDAWKFALELTKQIYVLTEHYPKSEMFGLISQLRRAAVGILANIAEGFSRMGASDKRYKYTIARGECSEVQALLIVSVAIGYLSNVDSVTTTDLVHKTGRCLTGLIQKFSRPNPNPIPKPFSNV